MDEWMNDDRMTDRPTKRMKKQQQRTMARDSHEWMYGSFALLLACLLACLHVCWCCWSLVCDMAAHLPGYAQPLAPTTHRVNCFFVCFCLL